MITHEAFCGLDSDHYGPCADSEHGLFILAVDKETLLWQKSLPPFIGYLDDPASIYQQEYLPAYRAGVEECLAQSYALGGIPFHRHHSRWTEVISFAVPVCEIEERGDLELSLPFGRFSLNARRARKGAVTSEEFHAFGGSVVGFGRKAEDDTEAIPVSIYGRISWNSVLPGPWWFQPSWITYADDTRSGYLGDYPRDLEAV